MFDTITVCHRNKQGVVYNETKITRQANSPAAAGTDLVKILADILQADLNRPVHFILKIEVRPVQSNETEEAKGADELSGGLTTQRIRELLTERETEVLEFLVQGKSTHAIAEILSIDIETVRTHRQHIYNTLGIHGIELLIIQSEKHHWFAS